MNTEIVKQQVQPLDNFDHYDDTVQTVDGDGERGPGRLTGTLLKFTNEAIWENSDGTDFSGKQLIAVNVRRTEVKWGDGVPVEVIELGPGDKYRDLDALNTTIPQTEWREGPDGKLHGPWQRQHVLELIDIRTMEAFSWPTSTIGGSIAIRELVERIQRMRRFRGDHVYPAVVLDHKHMNTRFGGRERPHLQVAGWYRIGDHGVEAVSDTPRAMLQQAPQPNLQPVSEPSLREELNDELPPWAS
jgi:hypothetical protein